MPAVRKYYENVTFSDLATTTILFLIYELVNNKIMKVFTNEITVISYNYEIHLSENQTSVNGIKKMYRAGSLQNRFKGDKCYTMLKNWRFYAVKQKMWHILFISILQNKTIQWSKDIFLTKKFKPSSCKFHVWRKMIIKSYIILDDSQSKNYKRTLRI